MKRYLAALAIVALLGSPALARKSATSGMMPTCAAGDPVVWVNTKTKVMHPKGDAHYGTTKHGMYACQSDATAKGAHMAGGSMSGGAMAGGSMSAGVHHKKRGMMASPMPGMATPMPAAT